MNSWLKWAWVPAIAVVVLIATLAFRSWSGSDTELPRCGPNTFDTVGFDYAAGAKGRPLEVTIEQSMEAMTDPIIDLSPSDLTINRIDDLTYSVLVGDPDPETPPYEVHVSRRPGGYLVEGLTCPN